MASTWNGSMTSDIILADDASPAILGVEMALDKANASEITTPRDDLRLLNLMTKTIEGVEGTYQAVGSFGIYFHDNTDNMDAEEFKEEYNEWKFGRKDLAVKNGSYDNRTFKRAKEMKVDLDVQIANRTIEILATYENLYKPFIMFQTLMTVPADGGGAEFPYNKEFGAIRNRLIDKRKIKSYSSTATARALGSNIRDNWRAIKSSSGVTFDDIEFCQKYISEPVGIFKQNLVLFGDSSDLSTIKRNVFSDFSPSLEEVLVGGIPSGVQATTVDGLKMIAVTTPLPEKVVAFINTGAEDLITVLESPEPEFRGIAVEFPKDGEKFVSNAKSFQGAKVVIQEVGYHMTGALDVLFLDLDGDNASPDRLMQADGFTKVENKVKDLAGLYYQPLNRRI